MLVGLVGYGLWLHWFLARHGLGLSGLRAVVMVLGVNLATVAAGAGAARAGARTRRRGVGRQMSIATSVASGMQAALLLARGRADGLRYVEDDMAGAARSFWAMAICLPAFVCLRLLAWTETGMPPHAAHVLRAGPDVVSASAGAASRCCRTGWSA